MRRFLVNVVQLVKLFGFFIVLLLIIFWQGIEDNWCFPKRGQNEK